MQTSSIGTLSGGLTTWPGSPDCGLQALAITDLHADLAASFDWQHRDLWDRSLAAQARFEHCTLVSTNGAFDAILHQRVWQEPGVKTIFAEIDEAAERREALLSRPAQRHGDYLSRGH